MVVVVAKTDDAALESRGGICGIVSKDKGIEGFGGFSLGWKSVVGIAIRRVFMVLVKDYCFVSSVI